MHKIKPLTKKTINPQDSLKYRDRITGLQKEFLIKVGINMNLSSKRATVKDLNNNFNLSFFKNKIFLLEHTEHRNKIITITPPKKTKVKK